MSERKSDQAGISTSIVDSGWEPEPPVERELPRYDDAPRDALVTRVDDQIQARIAAMNAPDEARAVTDVTVPNAMRPSALMAPVDERTHVDPSVPFSSAPPPQPPPLPLPFPFEPPRAFGAALTGRIRLGAAQPPLWMLLAPLFLVTAVVAALAGAAVTGPSSTAVPAAASVTAPSLAPDDKAPAPARSSTEPSAALPSDAELAALEKKDPRELHASEALALANGKAARSLAGVQKLTARLAADPGLAKDPEVIEGLLRFAQSAETARPALGAMAALPGPISADLLYEAWTGTAERSEATELARMLLLGKDVRPKASPALAVALDLREAETCEASAKILPRAVELGDKRSFGPLARLFKRTGCGAGKRQDCFPCLRNDDQLKDALNAVKKRREPELGRH